MIDRRLFLKDLGKFGMAMVVVSACGRDAPFSTATAISTAPSAGANPQFTPDMAKADASIARLAGFDFSVVLVGHGEPVTAGGAALVGALVSG